MMIWDILLSATIETGLSLLKEVGFGDAAHDLHNYLLKTDEKKRIAALEIAFERAIQAAADSEIAPLLLERTFQEEVVRALLEPLEGLNIQSLAGYWGEKFPAHVLPLRRFFNSLQNILLSDSIWGPVLERYQSLRLQQDVHQALQTRQLPTSDETLVKVVSQAADSYRATLRGDGAIAEGPNALAVGKNGILINGNVQIVINVIVEKAMSSLISNIGNERHKYLQYSADQANLLPWAKFTTRDANPEHSENLNLADVYIDLDTTEMRHVEREEELRQFLMHQREAERISAQEMVNRKSKLLMMGDPGSGKSTFIKHLTYLMAEAGLAQDPAPWLSRLDGWKHGVLLPVRIELRQIMAQANGKSNGMRLILSTIRAELAEWGLETFLGEFTDMLQNREGGLLFMLDGLDEVPTHQRQAIVDAVNDLVSIHPQHHYVVTCRPYAYVGQPWKLIGFHEVTLAPFSEEQINRFIHNWYERLVDRRRIEHSTASDKAHSLIQAVQRRDLLGLAERPLLLTVMAQLHAHEDHLPEDRTKLYADAVKLLLQRWESRLGSENGILEYLAVPGLKMSDLESGLYEVAFQAHSVGDTLDGTADISEGQLQLQLKRYLNHDWNKADLFVKYIRERAGLLIRHKTEAYTFPHHSFQEFLAACYWLGLADYPSEASRLVREDWDRWREVFVLAAGYAARSNRLGQGIAAVNALLPADCQGEVTQTEYLISLLAGQALLEIGLVGVRREGAGLAVLQRAQNWLLAALQSNQLEPKKRAEAGRILAKLGDLRLNVLSCANMVFCYISAGEFLMGSVVDDENAADDEKPQRTVNLPEYWIGKTHVTNAQFDEFVAAKGYQNPIYWAEAIKAGCWSEAGFKGRYDTKPRTAPNDYGESFSLPNHPVVGVSWYEAQAFIHWLTLDGLEIAEHWRVTGGESVFQALRKTGKLQIALPTEEQWEKAVRGTEGREYPWVGEFDINKANTLETGINISNAVGAFPAGANQYGLLDASGNVWEWTSSDKDKFKTVRGGSFLDPSEFARCACRFGGFPDCWYVNFGFRVVVISPFPSQLG